MVYAYFGINGEKRPIIAIHRDRGIAHSEENKSEVVVVLVSVLEKMTG